MESLVIGCYLRCLGDMLPNHAVSPRVTERTRLVGLAELRTLRGRFTPDKIHSVCCFGVLGRIFGVERAGEIVVGRCPYCCESYLRAIAESLPMRHRIYRLYDREHQIVFRGVIMKDKCVIGGDACLSGVRPRLSSILWTHSLGW